MKKRENWGGRMGFILAAVGSAIGLGNIWRFPYQLYGNRGGVFLIFYFIALITAGIPLLILEFGLGHQLRGSAPSVFRRIGEITPERKQSRLNWEWLGWFQTLISFFISTYYSVIVGWTIGYFALSIFSNKNAGWGSNTVSFFDDFLGRTTGGNPAAHLDLIHFTAWIPALSLLVWLIMFLILMSGVKKGIERASKFFMPALIVLLLFITGWSIFLKGAPQGLNELFKPDFSGMTFKDGFDIAIAAYTQIFYSISVGFSIMIAYSSYLPKKSDIVNNAFITGLLDCGFSIIAGILVFSIIGAMAFTQQKEFTEVVGSGGPGLTFITIPTALNSLPGMWGQIIGPIFFLCLFFAGITSAISTLETVVAAICDKFGITRLKVVTVVCAIGFTLSMIYSSRMGIEPLGTIDEAVSEVGILLAGVIEIILVAWIFKVKEIQKHINHHSDFSAGLWWKISITFITPLSLFCLLTFKGIDVIENAIKKIKGLQQGTTSISDFLIFLIFFIGVLLLILTASFIISRFKGNPHYLHDEEKPIKPSSRGVK